jgi:endothelin-converting enzyme
LHDQGGNVRNWWKTETANAFQRQKQCFIDQYNAIGVPDHPGLHINGNMTQGENIADNGGMRAAFNAMQKALETDSKKAQMKVEGMEEFGPEQLFFINYAFVSNRGSCGFSCPKLG